MTVTRITTRALLVFASLGLAGCAATDPDGGFAGMDPYENTNRAIHKFNVKADRNVLRPVAQGYDAVTPAVFKHMLGNGLSYLELPVDFANYLLQGEIDPALRTLGRFTLNTVLGIAVLDPATEFGLPREETDFGVTLGKWGVESGPYLVLPLLGPSSTRDLGGSVVDLAFSPTSYTGFANSNALDIFSIPLNAVGIVDARNRNADLIDEILYESPDSYISLRSIYLQRRQSLVAGDEADPDALPDIFDEEPPSNN